MLSRSSAAIRFRTKCFSLQIQSPCLSASIRSTVISAGRRKGPAIRTTNTTTESVFLRHNIFMLSNILPARSILTRKISLNQSGNSENGYVGLTERPFATSPIILQFALNPNHLPAAVGSLPAIKNNKCSMESSICSLRNRHSYRTALIAFDCFDRKRKIIPFLIDFHLSMCYVYVI